MRRLAIAAILAVLTIPLAWHFTPDAIEAIGTEHTSRRWCAWHVWARGELCERYHAKWSTRAGTLGLLRRLHTAECLFREGDKDGNGVLDYTSSLEALERAGLIDGRAFRRSGYTFAIRASPAAFSATAIPRCPICVADADAFLLDESGALRLSTTGPVGPESPVVGRIGE